MYPRDSDELQAARAQLVSYSARLLDDGLAVGSAGNISVRAGDIVAITPSGIGYADMRPGDVCLVTLDGTQILDGTGYDATETPSSETPMHLAIYAATSAAAVVHTHSPEVIALSASRSELPAIHYAITGLGGPVRVAPYVRFGSAGLAAAAVEALDGRSAVILRNHGAVSYGRDLAQAYDRALLLEWLARTYRLALTYGEPVILSAAELDEVTGGDPAPSLRRAPQRQPMTEPKGLRDPDSRFELQLALRVRQLDGDAAPSRRPVQVVALYPPSTTTTSPVTNGFDVTRETIVAATSAAVTQRPSGVIRARRCMSRS